VGPDTFVEVFEKQFALNRTKLALVKVEQVTGFARLYRNACVLSKSQHVYCRNLADYGHWRPVDIKLPFTAAHLIQNWNFAGLKFTSKDAIQVAGYGTNNEILVWSTPHWESQPLRVQSSNKQGFSASRL
jgi:hypothetical protein